MNVLTRLSTLSDSVAFKIFSISSFGKGSVGLCFTFGAARLRAKFSSTIFRYIANLYKLRSRSNLFDAVKGPIFQPTRNSVSTFKSNSSAHFMPCSRANSISSKKGFSQFVANRELAKSLSAVSGYSATLSNPGKTQSGFVLVV
jgi:hypothetical protein